MGVWCRLLSYYRLTHSINTHLLLGETNPQTISPYMLSYLIILNMFYLLTKGNVVPSQWATMTRLSSWNHNMKRKKGSIQTNLSWECGVQHRHSSFAKARSVTFPCQLKQAPVYQSKVQRADLPAKKPQGYYASPSTCFIIHAPSRCWRHNMSFGLWNRSCAQQPRCTAGSGSAVWPSACVLFKCSMFSHSHCRRGAKWLRTGGTLV